MDKSNHTRRERARSLIQAARWRAHLTDEGIETTAGLEQWLESGPHSQAAWSQAQAVWEECDDQANSPDILALRREAIEDARAAARKRWWHTETRQRWRQRALAAGLALVLVGAASVWLLNRPDQYRTALGERRVVTLDDGSKITLDSDTTVRVSYSDGTRELELIRGQAMFDVALDVERPFSVRAQDRKVLAMGTAFNVDLLGSALWVTLVNGRVVVLGETKGSGIELKPGQQLAARGGSNPVVSSVNLDMITAWEHGELMFDNESLTQVAERISRYSARKVEVLDPKAAAMKVSGVFVAGDVDRFVSAITDYLPLAAEPVRGGAIRLRYHDSVK